MSGLQMFVRKWRRALSLWDHYGTDTEGNWNDWTFQQDSAPSHASVNENKEKFKAPTQTWLNDHFPDFIKKDEWPASSPDLIHLIIRFGACSKRV
uniref:Uncharacterized protein n=1 Tax=Acrobeloides nanus TaxID=290746 RepID=A0A914DMI5_9BILA